LVVLEQVQASGGDGNGDLKLEVCELKLQISEMKAQLGQVIVKVMEAKDEIKEEIAKVKISPAVFSCQIM
jgi:hypothetical protein